MENSEVNVFFRKKEMQDENIAKWTDGTKRKYPAWLPGEKTSVRRNINAIYDGTEPITKRVDKQRY